MSDQKRSTNDHIFDDSLNEKEMLRLYIGPNADNFLAFHHLYFSPNAKKLLALHHNKKIPTNFNFAALLLGFVWFFYRKMYFIGFCILITSIYGLYLSPDIFISCSVFCHGMAAFISNILYLDKARKQIKEINELGLSRHEARKQIAQAGGISRISGTIGLLFLILIFIANLISSIPLAPQQCNNKDLQRETKITVKGTLNEAGYNLKTIQVTDFKSIEDARDKYNICSFTVTLESETFTAYAKSTGKSRGEFIYNTFISTNLQELRQKH